MAEIIRVSTIERLLFKPDAIPWPQVVLQSTFQKLQERYKFGAIQQGVDASGRLIQVIAARGEFLLKGASQAVEQLILEPIAIQFQIAVSSDEAREFLSDIRSLIAELDPNGIFSSATERTTTYQTQAVAKLAVPYEALYSEPLRRFLRESAATMLKPPDADLQILPDKLGWNVLYKTQSADYVYLPKVLTIEPRTGSNSSEMLYFTQSPTDFRGHKDLLESFERCFVGTHSRPGHAPKS
jgi:hypothetical protein